jgi:signal transduction histidine kinase/DNA-binding response OmpR family regulator
LLRQNELDRAYRAALQSLSDPVLIISGENRIFDLNHAAIKLYDPKHSSGRYSCSPPPSNPPGEMDLVEVRPIISCSTPEDLQGRSLSQIFPWLVDHLRVLRKSPAQTKKLEIDANLSQGTRRFEIKYSPAQPSELEATLSILVFRDITEAARAENHWKREIEINACFAGLSEILLGEDQSIQEIAEIILEEACLLTASEHGYVSEIEPVSGAIIGHTVTATKIDDCLGKKSNPSAPPTDEGGYRSPWGFSLSTLAPFYTNDPLSHPTFAYANADENEDTEAHGPPAGGLSLQRFLTAPAIADSELVGQIALANAKRDYTALDLQLIERLAVFYALSIQRARRSKELEKAKIAAETASEAKSRFLSSMSHEIRTPMNAIMGMAEVLWETPLNNEQRQFVQLFRNAGEELLAIINDILDISKIEAGHIGIENVPFNLLEVVEDTVEVLAVRAHRKGIKLFSRIHPGTPVHLIGDPHRLRQVLINLIGNAIKFTEWGHVVVEAYQQPSSPENRQTGTEAQTVAIDFSVTDTGIGIPADKIDAIFESFEQVDFSITRQHGGTGLGLGISRNLVEKMGGNMKVESLIDQGSRFTFTIRYELYTADTVSEATAGPNLWDTRAIVIDTHEVNRLITKETLTMWGAEVTEAENARQALEIIAAAPAGEKPFSLALIDRELPDMDGLDVARAIRENPRVTDCCILMFTTEFNPGDVAKFDALGIRRYLIKPVQREKLKNAVSDALRRTPADGLSHTPISDAPPPAKSVCSRILLVEDSKYNQLVVAAFLRDVPVNVDIAENGREGLEAFKRNGYDLVLMDLQMPVMDGLTAAREIRQWESKNQLTETPIVAMTAFAFAGDTNNCISAGCTDYLSKPVKKALFMETIGRYLTDLKENRTSYPPPTKRSDSIPPNDLAVHVEPALKPYVDDFLQSLSVLIERTKEQARKKEFNSICAFAHQMKGDGGTYGFNGVTEISTKIQHAANAEDQMEVMHLIEELENYLSDVEVAD